jgi:patatin-like phospholipase/acyl hydrolase
MKKVRVLSIDGGGIRGVIPATIMQYVEDQLIAKTRNPNTRLADYFDFIAGTSTGGILTCFYLTPDNSGANANFKFKAKDALNFYEQDGYKIFNESKESFIKWIWDGYHYSPKTLESILHKVFGNLKLSQLGKPCLITTYDMSVKNTIFFNSAEANKEAWDFYVRDVTRSTSAAPTYFPPAMIENQGTGEKKENISMVNLDGGVFANNPAMCGYAECKGLSEHQLGGKKCDGAADMLILSVGTGGGEIDLEGYRHSNRWNLGKWAMRAPNIMMDGAVDTVAFQMQEIFQTLTEENQQNYVRIDVSKEIKEELRKEDKMYSSDMANASEENINRLKLAANKTLDAAKKPKPNKKGVTPLSLDELIDKLIKIEENESVTENGLLANQQ